MESGHEQRDLHNEDIVTEILESGSPEEVEHVRAFLNVTEAQVQTYSLYAKQRKRVHEESRSTYQERKVKNPAPTPEELSMGCYLESIEPQVQQSVMNLRRKGYATYESGYYGLSTQKIGFTGKPLEHFQFPEDFLNTLAHKGVTVTVKPNAISFDCDRYVEIGELQKIWNDIESALPDLGKPAEPNMTGGAQNFRNSRK